MVKTAEDEKPPDSPKPEEVSAVVEKAHEEIEEKKQANGDKPQNTDYKKDSSDYTSYSPDTDVTKQEFELPSDDIIVDEDVTTHRFRKDTDPREYLERNKYNKPWDNPFLCYMKNCLDDRAKRVSVMTKKGFRSAMHGIVAAYDSMFGWVYRKK